MSITVPIMAVNAENELPSYAHPGDAGLDLRAAESCILKPFERAAVPCGVAVAIPQGYAGLVIPRSGLAIKHGISVVNGPGLIDSGYRGEIKAILVNLDPHDDFAIEKGDRIAQLVIIKIPDVELLACAELDDTERGADGFGSSGKN